MVVIQAPTGDRAIGPTQRRVCSAVVWLDQETVGGGKDWLKGKLLPLSVLLRRHEVAVVRVME